jgi:hypothetical protein
MGPVVMVVGDVIREEPLEVVLVQRNDVVEQLAPAAADPAFCDSISAKGSGWSFARSQLSWIESQPVLPVHTLRRDHDEELGRALVGKGFA